MRKFKEMYDEPMMAEWHPFAGATTWGELDSYQESSDHTRRINDIMWQFQCLIGNVMDDDDLTPEQRVSAISALSAGVTERIANPERFVKSKSLFARAKELVTGAKKDNNKKETYAISDGGTISVTKSADGTYRWVGIYSNGFKDLHGEIIPEAAHKEFAEYASKSGDYPELWLWHTPGTRIGVADWLDTHEGFAIASGTFDEGVPQPIIDTLLAEKDIAMSHGFRYRISDKSDGVYSRYRSEEISLLPREHVANDLTGFETLGVSGMEKEREQWLRKFLGEEQVSSLKSALSAVRIEAEKNGFSLKSIAAPILEMEAGATTADSTAPAAAPAATSAPAADATPVASAPAQSATTEPDILAQIRALLEPVIEEQKALRKEFEAATSSRKSLDEEVESKVKELITPRSGPDRNVAQKSAQFGNQATLVRDDDPDLIAAKEANTSDYNGVAAEYSKFAPGIAALMAPTNPNGKRN